MKRILLMVLILMISITVFAQESNDSTNVSIIKLNEVILNGVRTSKETPVTKTLVYRKSIDLSDQGVELSNILNETPNITSHSDNGTPFGYTYFRLRGIDQTRINMTLNGIPLNEPEDQGVYFSNYPNFSDNVRSVEIIRGVGTSSNGVSSFAGSINMVSENGKSGDIKSGMKVMGGSFGTQKASIIACSSNNDVSDNLSIYVNLSHYNTDGYRRESGGNGQSVFMNLFYDQSESRNFEFTSFVGRSENEMAWKPVSIIDINEDPLTNYNINDADDLFKQAFVQFKETEFINNNLSLNTSLFYNYLDGGYDYLSDGTKNLFLESNFYGIVSNLRYNKDETELNLGINLNNYNRDHSYSFTNSNTGFKREFSPYVKVLRKFNKLTVFGDIQYRYTDFKYDGDVDMDMITWNFINPKIGISYNNNDIKIYGSVGSSKREPTRTDLFSGFDWLSDASLIDDTPESVIDYELGSVYNKNNFDIGLNLFYMDFKDEITLSGGISPNGVPLSRNVDNSFRTGAEFSLKYIYSNFELGYNESYMYSEISDNDEKFKPILSPEDVRNIYLKYDGDNFLLKLSNKHHSDSFINLSNTEVTPKFDIFNFTAGYHRDRLEIMFDVNNIFDTTYFTNGSMVGPDFLPTDVPHYFIGSPRSYFMTLKILFE